MLTEDNIKTTGTITKEEDLINIERCIMGNTMVLESSLPFPGYHGSNLPEKASPNSIYLITSIRYQGEDILRAAKKIKKAFPYEFDASFGKAEICAKTYHFIRIRHLDCFSCIAPLQEAFAENGIKFMRKKSVSGKALITLQKFFSLKKIDEHIYWDNDKPVMYYFEIPDKPDWSLFKKVTIYIRSNIDNYSFDAALGVIYREEIADLIRIYAQEINIDQLQFVRKKYLYELTHPDHSN